MTKRRGDAKPEKKDNPNGAGGLGSNDQIQDKNEEKKAPEKALWEGSGQSAV